MRLKNKWNMSHQHWHSHSHSHSTVHSTVQCSTSIRSNRTGTLRWRSIMRAGIKSQLVLASIIQYDNHHGNSSYLCWLECSRSPRSRPRLPTLVAFTQPWLGRTLKDGTIYKKTTHPTGVGQTTHRTKNRRGLRMKKRRGLRWRLLILAAAGRGRSRSMQSTTSY